MYCIINEENKFLAFDPYNKYYYFSDHLDDNCLDFPKSPFDNSSMELFKRIMSDWNLKWSNRGNKSDNIRFYLKDEVGHIVSKDNRNDKYYLSSGKSSENLYFLEKDIQNDILKNFENIFNLKLEWFESWE